MLKVLFVVNLRSGNREAGNLEVEISEQSRNQNFDFLIYRLESANEEKSIRKEIAEYSPDIVAVAGGDGTVNLLTKILYNTNVHMLIIPQGSANGMAKELGIGNRIDNSLSLITTGKRKKIDLLKINGKICIHLGDIGLNAAIVRRFEKDPKRGLWTYAKHLFKEVFIIRDHHFYIVCDDEPMMRLKAVSLTFAN